MAGLRLICPLKGGPALSVIFASSLIYIPHPDHPLIRSGSGVVGKQLVGQIRRHVPVRPEQLVYIGICFGRIFFAYFTVSITFLRRTCRRDEEVRRLHSGIRPGRPTADICAMC